jgi:hypothetical protein
MVNYAQSIDGRRSFIQSSLDAVYSFAPNLVQDSVINQSITALGELLLKKIPCNHMNAGETSFLNLS